MSSQKHFPQRLTVRDRDELLTFLTRFKSDLVVDAPARTGGARLTAHRIDDHRPEYLVYEGPLSGDRGSVRRLARGMVVSWDRGEDVWRMEIDWPDPAGGLRRQSLRLSREALGGDAWAIEIPGD